MGGPRSAPGAIISFYFFLLLFFRSPPPARAAGLRRPLLNPSRSPAPRRAARHRSAPCRPRPAPPAEGRALHSAASCPPPNAGPRGSTRPAPPPPRGSPPSRQVLRAYLPGGAAPAWPRCAAAFPQQLQNGLLGGTAPRRSPAGDEAGVMAHGGSRDPRPARLLQTERAF